MEPDVERPDDATLQAKTGVFRERLDRGEGLDDLLPEAFAVVREASRRVLGQRHYDVQLLGGAALHRGQVVEMKTGEGKTLASTLPAYLNALVGKGVHVVTANPHLAARDAEWMGRLHRWLGLEIGLLRSGQKTPYVFEQYGADITYGTAVEFAADYLRDNLLHEPDSRCQRGHSYAIVDEADLLLVDNARSQSLLMADVSGDPHAAEARRIAASVAADLQPEIDYDVDEATRAVAPTGEGIRKAEKAFGVDNLYGESGKALTPLLHAALAAKELYLRDRAYVVEDGTVKTIDPDTGRLHVLTWPEGIRPAVETKEGVTVTAEKQKVAEILYRNYFCLYDKLAGMTGTAMAAAPELNSMYGLETVAIPTNRPVARVDHGDLVFPTEDAKLDTVVKDIAKRHKSAQPVLVGTTSVEASESLSQRLQDEGVPHRILNAKNHASEADIISQAGRLGAVTVATSMAGHGVDIMLGGDPDAQARDDLRRRDLDPDAPANAAELAGVRERCAAETEAERRNVRDLGGLCVLGTDRHVSRRLDDQLRGRAGRQGDPGESQFYVSMEGTVLRSLTKARWIADKVSGDDDDPITGRLLSKSVERSQASLEQQYIARRKQSRAYEDVLDEQRRTIYALREELLTEQRQVRVLQEYLPEAVDELIDDTRVEDEEVPGLEALEAGIRALWPATLTTDDLARAARDGTLRERLLDDARDHHERREKEETPPQMRIAERTAVLQAIDRHWAQHLHQMEALSDGIGLRSIGGIDPLHAWQREGFEMFEAMLRSIHRSTVAQVMYPPTKSD